MKWSITNMLVTNDVVLDVVFKIGFCVSDTQHGLTGRFDYDTEIKPYNPEDFTLYANVTEAQAIKWVKEALGEEITASMESQVQAIIDGQKIPTPQPAPLPWVAE
jgi:hypothetical protein